MASLSKIGTSKQKFTEILASINIIAIMSDNITPIITIVTTINKVLPKVSCITKKHPPFTQLASEIQVPWKGTAIPAIKPVFPEP